MSPTVTGSAPKQIITYRNVWQGIDLQYTVGGSELKETIVVKSRVAQTGFDFTVDGTSLSPVSERPGSLRMDGSLSDFQIAAPSVGTFDKGVIGGEPIVSQSFNGNKLHVSLDAEWLKKQAFEAFPVAIDPTVTRWSAANNGGNSWYVNFKSDGYICYPGGGCGNSTGIASGQTWRFAYHVDMSGISGYLASASLYLEMPDPDGVHYWGTYGSQPTKVEHASCLNSINCVDHSWGVSSGSIGYSGNIDVTGLYRNSGASDAWMMVAGNEAGGETYKLFAVDRTSVTFTYDQLPSLSTPTSPLDNGGSVTSQPTLMSSASSDPDGPAALQYRYIIGTSKSVPASNPNNALPSISGVIADSGLSPFNQWSVPDNVLQNGTTYYWQASVWDGYSGAPQVYGPVYSFKVDLRNGKEATQAYDSVGPVSIDQATGNLATSISTHSISALGGSLGLSLDYNSPQRSRPGLVAEYFNNPAHTTNLLPDGGTPVLSRVETNIDYNWASNTPYAGLVDTDWWQSRWTGWFTAPVTGNYSFGGNNDDRMAVYVNNTLLYDNAGCYSGVCTGSSISLTAGQVVPIKVLFNEYTGSAFAHLYVSGAVTQQVVPTSWLQTGIRPIATPHGLIGRYYTDDGSHTFPTDPNDSSRIFLTRTDTSMNLNWGSGSPVPNGPTDNFLVRWSGYFIPSITDSYTFGAGSDDGVRVTVNGTQVVNAWSDHTATPIVYASSGMTLNQGTAYQITVEYYEHDTSAQMGLYMKRAGLPSAPDTIVDSTLLAPQAQVLPDGWSLASGSSTALAYDFAVIGQGSVVLWDSAGKTHEYKFANGGFAPPTGEDGHMVRNGDGTITLQDVDGNTYVFNTDGTLKSSSLPMDDRNPGALQYTYGGSPAHLTQITDGVSSSRWAKILYSADTNCPSVPAGFGAVPANMICAVVTSDGTQSTPANLTNGNVTQFAYSSAGRLARILLPGNAITDYGYDSYGRITQIRESLANDAIVAGVRTQDGTETTQFSYDPVGRVSGVTLPAANAGNTRQAHTYEYLPVNGSSAAYTKTHIANATEPSGFSRKVTYDSTFRTTDDADVANLTTHTDWDAAKDLVQAVTDPAGLKSTTIYDYADRPTEQYGPAPSSWYGADRRPFTSYVNDTPHKKTGYDESINGLASTYYNVGVATNGTGVSTKLLEGSPKLHATGVGPTNGDIVKTWNGTPPFTPDTGKGWGARLSGNVHFTAGGNYTFKVKSDDGVRLWVDDTLTVNDWTDGAYRDHAVGTFNNTNNPADSWHRIRLDYYNKSGDSDARLELWMTAPGGSETSSIGSLLTPLYGMVTSQTTYDADLGDSKSTTNYGSNPELGLAQSTTLNPSPGLNLTGTSAYETQGATGSYLRQLSKTLPGGGTTSYAYYSTSESRQNPCDTSKTYLQAGMLKFKYSADPENDPLYSSPGVINPAYTGRVTETVYDSAGRTVATRYNTDAWTCNTYDTRGRITSTTIPSFNSQPSRTVTTNWSVGGNPLVVSVSDANGTITTTTDLLGRTVSYTDANGNTTTSSYDNLGRLITRQSTVGTEEFTYNNYNQLTSQKLDGTVVATPGYDAYGRLYTVDYPTLGTIPIHNDIARDDNGRIVGYSYTYDGSVGGDYLNRSQSGQAMSGYENGYAKTYSYDSAARVTGMTLDYGSYGTATFGYGYGAPTDCSGSSNPNAAKNGNRTTTTKNIFGTSSSFSYCYDYSDRLTSSTDPNVGTPQYDSHGNTTQLGDPVNGSVTTFGYDSADRNVKISDGYWDYLYTRDAQNRITRRVDQTSDGSYVYADHRYGFTDRGDAPDFVKDETGAVVEKYVYLPGGGLITIRPAETLPEAKRTYSLPSIHGNTILTVNGLGRLADGYGIWNYGAFGEPIWYNNNGADGVVYGWKGQYGKMGETTYLQLAPIQMGSRVYIPSLGRFLQVDPVDGGVQNNYIYPVDPINYDDITGQNAKAIAGEVVANIGENADNMGGVLTYGLVGLGIGACIVTTGGLCTVAVPALAALVAGSKEYYKSRNATTATLSAAQSFALDRLGGSIGSKGTDLAMPYVARTYQASRQVSQRAVNRAMGPVRQRVNAVTGGAAGFAAGKAVPTVAAPEKILYAASPSILTQWDYIVLGYYGGLY